MMQAGAVAEAPRGPWGWQMVALVVLAGWVTFTGLAQPSLIDPDEPRTAIIAGSHPICPPSFITSTPTIP